MAACHRRPPPPLPPSPPPPSPPPTTAATAAGQVDQGRRWAVCLRWPTHGRDRNALKAEIASGCHPGRRRRNHVHLGRWRRLCSEGQHGHQHLVGLCRCGAILAEAVVHTDGCGRCAAASRASRPQPPWCCTGRMPVTLKRETDATGAGCLCCARHVTLEWLRVIRSRPTSCPGPGCSYIAF